MRLTLLLPCMLFPLMITGGSLCAQPHSDPQDLLERHPDNHADIPIPKEKPPLSNLIQTPINQKQKMHITGTAGPRMPAVPPGQVVSEIIEKTSKSTTQRTASSDDEAPQSQELEQVQSSQIPAEKTSPPPTDPPNLITSAALSPKTVSNTKFFRISARIPHMSLLFQNSEQTELTPAQESLLYQVVESLRQQEYAGNIRVQAYSPMRHRFSEDARKIAVKRVTNVRKILLKAGIPAQQLDIRALPAEKKDLMLDLYLTGPE